MRTPHRIVLAMALVASLFSGRFLLARALRSPRHAPVARAAPASSAAAASSAWSVDAPRRLAESLAHEISRAPQGLGLELSQVRRECNALADAAARNATIDPQNARRSMARGHGLLAGVHLQRSDAAWRAHDFEQSGSELEAAIEEVDSAIVWRGDPVEVARGTWEEARSLARRLEAGDSGVLAQDFEGSAAVLACALSEAVPAAARATGTAPCGSHG